MPAAIAEECSEAAITTTRRRSHQIYPLTSKCTMRYLLAGVHVDRRWRDYNRGKKMNAMTRCSFLSHPLSHDANNVAFLDLRCKIWQDFQGPCPKVSWSYRIYLIICEGVLSDR